MPSPKLIRYSAPYEPRSSLLKNPPESSSPIPSIEELEQLLPELRQLRESALERSKKASHDLRTLQDSMRKLKEKEKGKAKAVEKVKRERDFTPIPNDDSRLPHYPGSKPRVGSAIPTSARSSVDPRRSALEDKKLLKKRKHGEVDPGESDSNQTQRARKGSPAVPNHTSGSSSHKAHPKSSIPPSISHPKVTAGPDFTVPPSINLLPARPPIPSPPVPGPSKPINVKSDFSKLKQPPQTQVTTFYSSTEPYIRPVREEDVGFLEYTGDEVEPFIMPKLGVHYLEVWEEQDANGYTGIVKAKEAPASAFVAPKPTWDPSTLIDQDMSSEEKGHGPLTERVISALLPIPDLGWKGVKAAEDAMEGRPGGSGAAAARRERLNVSDLESRIRDTMRYHGLLESVPDFSEKVDDPIATALRHAQQELRTVLATNKARRERLSVIAKDRLGYQEYLEVRDMLDKSITQKYAYLSKKPAAKQIKNHKKKKLAGAAAASAAAAAANAEAENPTGVPAAVGLNPDDDNHLLVDEQMKKYVETRRRWVEEVGTVFDELQRQKPGRIWGFPTESVYQGVEEEVREKLLRDTMSTGTSGPSNFFNNGGGALGRANGVHPDEKGKGRASDDAMDLS